MLQHCVHKGMAYRHEVSIRAFDSGLPIECSESIALRQTERLDHVRDNELYQFAFLLHLTTIARKELFGELLQVVQSQVSSQFTTVTVERIAGNIAEQALRCYLVCATGARNGLLNLLLRFFVQIAFDERTLIDLCGVDLAL